MSKEIDSHTFEWMGLTRARCVYNNVFRVLSVEMSVVAHRKRKKMKKKLYVVISVARRTIIIITIFF